MGFNVKVASGKNIFDALIFLNDNAILETSSRTVE